MTENRVLTLAEVLALEEGREVWVEDRDWYSLNGKHRMELNHQDGCKCVGPCLLDKRNRYWPLNGETEKLIQDHDLRVWSLPQPPTPEELAANPWPEVAE